MTKTTTPELSAWIDEMETWREAGAKGLSPDHPSLEGADLQGCDISRASIYDAVMRGADLRGASLRFCEVSGCDLRGADLRGCDMRDADLTGCDLRGANLDGAIFEDTIMYNADLSGTGYSYSEGLRHGLIYPDGSVRYGHLHLTVAEWREQMHDLCEEHAPESYDRWMEEIGNLVEESALRR